MSVRETEVENQILSFDIAQLIKPLLYDHRILAGEQGEVSHAVRFCPLLRPRRERPCRCSAKQGDEFAPSHSGFLPSSTARVSLPHTQPAAEWPASPWDGPELS